MSIFDKMNKTVNLDDNPARVSNFQRGRIDESQKQQTNSGSGMSLGVHETDDPRAIESRTRKALGLEENTKQNDEPFYDERIDEALLSRTEKRSCQQLFKRMAEGVTQKGRNLRHPEVKKMFNKLKEDITFYYESLENFYKE